METSITIKPDHKFHYATEWDPRKHAHTKGGYLEGEIKLPTNMGDLRVLLSTVPIKPLALDKELVEQYPKSQEIHPTILTVVRMGRGKRMQEREPVPNGHHWQQEFHVVNKCLRIRNKTSEDDLLRYPKIPVLPEMDDVLMIGDDMTIELGKRPTQLNLVIIIPKTQERSCTEDLSINKIISDRISDPDAIHRVMKYFRKEGKHDSKKVNIKVEVYSLESNILISSATSNTIFDKEYKHHLSVEFCHVFPLRGCAEGGRKVIMVSVNQITKDVIPKFQLYNKDGKRMEEMEHLVTQPDYSTQMNMKETIIFITPPQPHIETVMKYGLVIKLLGLRLSDGFESKKYIFNYVPSDYYDPCIFCTMKPDGHEGKAKLPGPTELSKTGKRRLIQTKDSEQLHKKNAETSAHLAKIMRLDQSYPNPHDPDSLSASIVSDSNSYPDLPELNVGTESSYQDIENNIPPLVVTAIPGPMPGLIDLKQLQTLQNCHPHLKTEPGKDSCELIVPKEEHPTMLQPNDPYDFQLDLGDNQFKNIGFDNKPLSPFPHVLSSTPTSQAVSVIVKSEHQPVHQVRNVFTTSNDSTTVRSYPVNLQPIQHTTARRIVNAQLNTNSLANLASLDDLDSIDNNHSSFKPIAPWSGNHCPELRVERTLISHPYPSMIKPATSLINTSIDSTILKSYLMNLKPIEIKSTSKLFRN